MVSHALQRFCENMTGLLYIPTGCPWDDRYIEGSTTDSGPMDRHVRDLNMIAQREAAKLVRHAEQQDSISLACASTLTRKWNSQTIHPSDDIQATSAASAGLPS